jgi:hypothetical protein
VLRCDDSEVKFELQPRALQRLAAHLKPHFGVPILWYRFCQVVK